MSNRSEERGAKCKANKAKRPHGIKHMQERPWEGGEWWWTIGQESRDPKRRNEERGVRAEQRKQHSRKQAKRINQSNEWGNDKGNDPNSIFWQANTLVNTTRTIYKLCGSFLLKEVSIMTYVDAKYG